MAGSAKVSIIVAIADNGVIGKAGGLPWRLGSDLRRFRRLTLGHPLIMGRKTFEAIGKPLDGRDSIVISRKPQSLSLAGENGVFAASSFEEALGIANERAAMRGVREIFVTGGAEIFAQALPIAHRIYLTRVHGCPEGETRWQPSLAEHWREMAREERPAGERDEFPVTDIVLERVSMS